LYELVLNLDGGLDGKQLIGCSHHNTHPKMSWYLGKEYFNKLFEKIESPEDFYIINKVLDDCFTINMNHKDTTKKVEGLLEKLR